MSQAIDIALLKSLPVADRLKLIETLWDSIEAEDASALPVPDWQKEELDRRLAAFDPDDNEGQSWEEVRRQILSRT